MQSRDEGVDVGRVGQRVEEHRFLAGQRMPGAARAVAGRRDEVHPVRIESPFAAAQERGWSFEGLDVNEGAVDFVRKRGLPAAVGTLDTLSAESVDVLAIWNTFEQLPEARTAAHTSRRALRVGGILALRVPNGDFYARYRERAIRGDFGD